MSIHTSLAPLPEAPLAYDWPDLPELGSGGFASVRALSSSEVLKLTCCTASNRWLTSALARKERWSAAFPQVLEDLGDLATDADAMRFRGWRMERLFELDDKKGAIAARSATIRRRMTFDKGAATRPVAPDHEGLDGLFSVIDFCSVEPDEHWMVDAKVALMLASACQGDLREGFLQLRAFIIQHRVKLDVAQRSNIMMDCFGRLRLADPLTMRLGGVEDAPEPEAHHWVAIRVPVAQRGFTVEAVWAAAPCTQQASSSLVAKYAAMPGVIAQVCSADKAAQLVEIPPLSLKVFDFKGKLDGLLREDLRSDLFSNAHMR